MYVRVVIRHKQDDKQKHSQRHTNNFNNDDYDDKKNAIT